VRAVQLRQTRAAADPDALQIGVKLESVGGQRRHPAVSVSIAALAAGTRTV